MNKMLLKGNIEDAQYKNQIIKEYSVNPFIEALPEILSEEEAARSIAFFPTLDIKEKDLPNHLRPHCIKKLEQFVLPFSPHIELEQAISRAIRAGYLARNPLSKDYKRRLREKNMLKPENQLEGLRSTAGSFSLIGESGVGKSTAVERILMTYPQVIQHYRDDLDVRTQLVWLKLDCPPDGSIKSLCLHFFIALDSILDTNYYAKLSRGQTTEELLPQVAHKATLHGLGVLVIDEVQNLSQAKSGGAQVMLNFFVQLINTIGLPIVLIGTPKANTFLIRQLRQARRCTGDVDFEWHRLSLGEEWDLLLDTLFRYQWTQIEVPLTQEISLKYYEETQGIVDLVIKLHMAAQRRAINTGLEKITVELLDAVAKDSFNAVRPIIKAIRESDLKQMLQYDDLFIPWDNFNNSQRIAIPSNPLSNIESNEKKNNIDFLTNWLVEQGVNIALAPYIAYQTVALSGESNLDAMKQYALDITDKITQKFEDMQGAKTGEKAQKKGNLLGTIEKALSADESGIAALKKEGYIIGTEELVKS